MSTISRMMEYKIDGPNVVLSQKTVDCIERGGTLGAAVTRVVQRDVEIAEQTLTRRLRVVGPDGEPLSQFASN